MQTRELSRLLDLDSKRRLSVINESGINSYNTSNLPDVELDVGNFMVSNGDENIGESENVYENNNDNRDENVRVNEGEIEDENENTNEDENEYDNDNEISGGSWSTIGN